MAQRIMLHVFSFVLLFSLISIASSDRVMAQIIKNGISSDDTNAGGIISKKEAITGPTFIMRIIPLAPSNTKAAFYF